MGLFDKWKNKAKLRNEQEHWDGIWNNMRRMFGNHYDASKSGRLQNDWATTTDTPSANFKQNWRAIIARSIHSADNNPHTAAILNVLDSNVIGRGLRPVARVKDKQGTPVEGINKALDEGWKRYNDEWDAAGVSTQLDSQSIRFLEMVRTGSTINNLLTAPKGNFLPIENQMVNVLRLDDSRDTFGDSFSDPEIKTTSFGINLNASGRAVSYWIKGMDKPVPANKMRLSFNKKMAEQYIGVPWLYAALKYLWANENLISDKLVSSKMQAMIGLFVPNGLMNPLINKHLNSDNQLELQPGKVYYGQSKDDVPQIIQADDSIKDVLVPLQTMLLHAISMTQGISYQTVTRDLVKTNMASGRMNVNEDRKTYRKIQKMVAKTICQPDWNVFVEWMFLTGNIPGRGLVDYNKNQWKYNQVQWIPTGFDFIDPSKEASAAIELISNRMMTYEEWFGERGTSWVDAFEQIKLEQETMKDMKIEPADVQNAMIQEKAKEKAVASDGDDESDEDKEGN